MCEKMKPGVWIRGVKKGAGGAACVVVLGDKIAQIAGKVSIRKPKDD